MILQKFPGTPRPVQVSALQEIEAVWNKSDVIVVQLPVASGKSRIAVALARWMQTQFKMKSRILTPTNILVDQYLSDFPTMVTLSAQDKYVCHNLTTEKVQWNCKDVKKELGKFSEGCCYLKAMKRAHAVPYGVFNYWTYLANRLYADCLIIDEAHNVINLVREISAKKLWRHLYGYPPDIRTYQELADWAEDAKENLPQENRRKLAESLWVELSSGKPRYLVEKAEEPFHGQMRDCLKLLPIDVRDQPPLLWPNGKVKKIILLSATIGQKDVEQLGLDSRRVAYISADSPIPAQQRPVVLDSIGNMSMRHQDGNLPALVRKINEYLEAFPGEKGFIHAPYSLVQKLRPMMGDNPRLIFHDRNNKMEQYQHFRDTPDTVMIASGLYEGIDLPEDLGRWQVLLKIPYPSLGEPAVKWLAQQDPKWYKWEAVKQVLQASGRICRGPEDFGVTYIIDESFRRLYLDNQELFPGWYRNSVEGI